MSIEENKRIAREVFDAFVAGDLRGVRNLLAPDAVFHQCGFLQPISGESIFQGGFAAGGRIRERAVRLERMIGEGDVVALHWRTSGVYSDPESSERDGTPVNFPSMTFARFEMGKIAEIWNIRDTSTLESQLWEASSSGRTDAR